VGLVRPFATSESVNPAGTVAAFVVPVLTNVTVTMKRKRAFLEFLNFIQSSTALDFSLGKIGREFLKLLGVKR
jgi:hypothetical protein